MKRRPGLLVMAILLAGCNEPSVVSSRPPATEMAGRDASAPSSNGSADAPSGSSDAFVIPDTAPPAMPCGGCGPGQTCREQTCVDDCRSDRAVPCAAPKVCDFITGACVAPRGRAAS